MCRGCVEDGNSGSLLLKHSSKPSYYVKLLGCVDIEIWEWFFQKLLNLINSGQFYFSEDNYYVWDTSPVDRSDVSLKYGPESRYSADIPYCLKSQQELNCVCVCVWVCMCAHSHACS